MYTFELFSPDPNRTNREFDECEDAYPLCESRDNDKLSIFGVFDGVSASLARHVKLGHKSAFLGSNETKRIFETIWSVDNFKNIFDMKEYEIKDFFENIIFSSLLDFAQNNDLFADVKVFGKDIYLLGTTAAVIFCRKNIDELGRTTSVDVVCIWAGDSRGYLLDSAGLHQLTKDDQATDSDAYESIINQPTLNNYIRISQKRETASNMQFILNCKKYRFNEKNQPFFIFCSTDGCYDYCDSPMHFEKALLDSILESIKSHEDSQDFEKILKTKINTNSDDCTLSAGFFSFNENDDTELIKSVFSKRQTYLNELIGNTSDLQKNVFKINGIKEKISYYQINIDNNLKTISNYISNSHNLLERDYPEIAKKAPEDSFKYLLNNGVIKEHCPVVFREYTGLLSKIDQLNKELSELQANNRTKLREIWYGEYKDGYERIYLNRELPEKTQISPPKLSDTTSNSNTTRSEQINADQTKKADTNQHKLPDTVFDDNKDVSDQINSDQTKNANTNRHKLPDTVFDDNTDGSEPIESATGKKDDLISKIKKKLNKF